MNKNMKKHICVRYQQQGFVLIIALILMVVMAIGAITSYRLSGAANVINNNVRATTQAHQAAESAISYCRALLVGAGGLKVIEDSEGDKWTEKENWDEANVLDGLELPGKTKDPECLVENISKTFETKKKNTTDQIAAFKITARGYSPNYTENGSGQQKTGAQSWVQFTIVRTLG